MPQISTTSSRAPAKRESAWYLVLIYSALAFGLADYLYSDITRMELSGGEIRMNWLLILAYKAGGKWAVVGLVGAAGVYALILSIVRLMKSLRRTA